jgi:hypothetical protein
LLLISAGKAHVSPASVVEANFKLYEHSDSSTNYKEFPEDTHYTLGQKGWEEVADYVLGQLPMRGQPRLPSSHNDDQPGYKGEFE